jgi:hypothetical protein
MFNRISKKALDGLFALVVVLGLSLAAYAQNGIEQKISFYLDGKVGNEVVKKGTYTVSIPEAEQGAIEIKLGGKKTVKAQFTKRQNTTVAVADKMTYRDNGDGARTIASISPRGRKFTLVLDNASSVGK